MGSKHGTKADMALNGHHLKKHRRILYLVTSDGCIKREMVSKINQAKLCQFGTEKTSDKNICLECIWKQDLDLKGDEQRRIQVFELWYCRQMLKIVWVSRVNNKEVLLIIDTVLTLIKE